MANITILIGTVYGTAENVATAVATQLEQLGHTPNLCLEPTVQDIKPDNLDTVLVITSTTGAGDIPANLAPLYNECKMTYPLIQGKPYGIIALGDSSYTTFCGAGELMDELMMELAAKRVDKIFRIDALEHSDATQPALEWLPGWLKKAL